MSNSAQSSVNRNEDRAQELRKKAGRFRILIIGRANSGKTTILQKICKTDESPEIFNSKGEKVRYLSVLCLVYLIAFN
jgi:septin family protein